MTTKDDVKNTQEDYHYSHCNPSVFNCGLNSAAEAQVVILSNGCVLCVLLMCPGSQRPPCIREAHRRTSASPLLSLMTSSFWKTSVHLNWNYMFHWQRFHVNTAAWLIWPRLLMIHVVYIRNMDYMIKRHNMGLLANLFHRTSLKGDILYRQVLAVTSRFENQRLLKSQVGMST